MSIKRDASKFRSAILNKGISAKKGFITQYTVSIDDRKEITGYVKDLQLKGEQILLRTIAGLKTSFPKKEMAVTIAGDDIIIQVVGQKRKVRYSSKPIKDYPYNSLIDFHTHPIDYPPSNVDLWAFLSHPEVFKSVVLTSNFTIYELEKTERTYSPLSRVLLSREYNALTRSISFAIMKERGIKSIEEFKNPKLIKEVEEEALKRFCERYHIKYSYNKIISKHMLINQVLHKNYEIILSQKGQEFLVETYYGTRMESGRCHHFNSIEEANKKIHQIIMEKKRKGYELEESDE